MRTRKPVRTWTFQPTPVVRSLVSKAVRRACFVEKTRHGVRSRLINIACAAHFLALTGKRELP